jgi:drug/metabolite transporter (DMT)-like permease
VAHVLLFQASSPFLAALLAWFLMREPIPRRTWVAMAAALAGVAIMIGGSLGSGGIWGDALCFVMAGGFAVVIVITRSHREISMTPATALGMAIAFAATAPFSHIGGVPGRDIFLLAALGAGQIALGLILFTAGARLIPAAQAGLITLIEIVLGPLWVWLIYREEPDAPTIVGGSVIVGAVLLHAFADLRRPARLSARPEPLA